MIHYFNLGHETAVLSQNPYYALPKNLAKMQEELSFLPAWYAQDGDFVLTNDVQDIYYQQLQENLNFQVEPISETHLSKHSNRQLCFWGNSLQASHHFQLLNDSQKLDLIIPKWKPEFFKLNSRETAKLCLEKLVDSCSYLDQNIVPVFFSKLDDLEIYINQNTGNYLAKSPYSSSGRGLLQLPNGQINRTEKQILQGMLNKQKTFSVEPLHRKVLDFAMEFMFTKHEVKFEAYSLFQTSKRGAYLGNILESQENIEKLIGEYISLDLLNEIRVKLEEVLSSMFSGLYEGCIGVDMLIYEEESCCKLQPCIEINMRYNMGYLAYKLYENYMIYGSKGKFNIEFHKQNGQAYKKHLELSSQFPAIYKDKKLEKGYLSLCPIKAENSYIAYVLID